MQNVRFKEACFGVLTALLATLFAVPAAAEESQATRTDMMPEELAAFTPSFVLVKVFFKKNEEEVKPHPSMYDFESFDDMYESRSGMYKSFVEGKRPLKQFGLVVEPDIVLADDMGLDKEYLDHIEIEDVKGNRSAGARLAVLRNAPAVLFRIAEPQRLAIQPVAFVDAPDVVKDVIAEIGSSIVNEKWVLAATRLGRAVRVGADGQPETVLVSGQGGVMDIMDSAESSFGGFGIHMMGFPGLVSGVSTLVITKDKRPVGVGLSGPYSANVGEAPLWYGKAVMADERLPFETLDAQMQQLKARFAESLLEIRVAFRQKTKSGSGSWFEQALSSFEGAMPDFEGREAPIESFYYGLPIGPRTLFVPKRISREHAKQIDVIEVKDGDKTVAGHFTGMFSDVAAFLVSCDADLAAPPVELVKDKPLPQFSPLGTVSADRRFGGKWLDVNYARVVGRSRGYKDMLELRLSGFQPVGTFYVDLAGPVRAVFLEQRRESEDRNTDGHFSPYSHMSSGKMTRAYEMGELAPLFAEPAKYLDTTIVALPEKEEKRRMWLGVEFQAMTPELAREMAVEKPTKDGTIGLVVSTVYAGSPAEQLGLKSGDILLKITEPGGKEPNELQASPSHDEDFNFSDLKLPFGLDKLGIKMPPKKQWKSRENVLTRLLEVIGEAKEVTLTYLAEGKDLKTVPFTVAVAPPDFDSAEKFKDERLGLTVKAATYEVKHALQIPESSNPVVVAKVEEGTPAAVAQIREYELITKLNDADVSGLEGFKTMIETARAQKPEGGKAVLRFTVQSLGQSRLADVGIE